MSTMPAINLPLSWLYFLLLVTAQQPTTNFSSTDYQSLLSGPNAVSQTIRNTWCTSEHTLCSDLCSGSTTPTGNSCNPNELTFSCACSANNSQPGLQYYETSLIWNICESVLGNCIADNANDLPAQNQCKTSYVCGTLNATDVLGASSSSTALTPLTSSTPASSTFTSSTTESSHSTSSVTSSTANTQTTSTTSSASESPNASKTISASSASAARSSVARSSVAPVPAATVTITVPSSVSTGDEIAIGVVVPVVVLVLVGALAIWSLRRQHRHKAMATAAEKREPRVQIPGQRPSGIDGLARHELETRKPELEGYPFFGHKLQTQKPELEGHQYLGVDLGN